MNIRKSLGAATVLISIIAILFFLVSGASLYFLKLEMDKRVLVEQALEKTELAKARLEKNMDGLQKSINQYNDKLKESNLKNVAIAKELNTTKEGFDRLFNENSDLKASLKNEVASKDSALKNLSDLNANLSKVQEQLKKSEELKVELEKQVKELESTQVNLQKDVDLEKIVISPEDVPADLSDGSVIVVNKPYNFIVISLGSRDNIMQGLVFTVFQKDKPIGDIVIEKVEESMSVASFLDDAVKNKVKEGDIVKVKK